MNIKSYPLLCMLLITLLFSCKQKNSGQHAAHAAVYTCSMHPQIMRDKPGNCPVCNMVLVKKDNKAETVNNVSLRTLLQPANESVISQVAVTTLQQRNEQPVIHAQGTVQYDDRQMGTVSSRLEGRIEKLYVRYRYQHVQKGEKLFDLYSPELLTSQQNLLFLLKSDPENNALISAARERLLLLGMSAPQIAQAASLGKPLSSVSVYSGYTGYVNDPVTNQQTAISGNLPAGNDNTSYSETTQELTIREGMYLQKGQPVFNIINAQRALLVMDIFTTDQSAVKQGDAVKIMPEASLQNFTATIDYIEPFFPPGNKTVTARVYFNNAGLKLPVGSRVQGTITAKAQSGNWLPVNAVYTLGLHQVVFKKEGGAFRAHTIITGRREAESIQVLQGVAQTDSVAVNAHFLTDNESFITVK